VDLCAGQKGWEPGWEAVFDRDAGGRLAQQRRRIMGAGLEECVADFEALQQRAEAWDAAPPRVLCMRRALGPAASVGAPGMSFPTLLSWLRHTAGAASPRTVSALVGLGREQGPSAESSPLWASEVLGNWTQSMGRVLERDGMRLQAAPLGPGLPSPAEGAPGWDGPGGTRSGAGRAAGRHEQRPSGLDGVQELPKGVPVAGCPAKRRRGQGTTRRAGRSPDGFCWTSDSGLTPASWKEMLMSSDVPFSLFTAESWDSQGKDSITSSSYHFEPHVRVVLCLSSREAAPLLPSSGRPHKASSSLTYCCYARMDGTLLIRWYTNA